MQFVKTKRTTSLSFFLFCRFIFSGEFRAYRWSGWKCPRFSGPTRTGQQLQQRRSKQESMHIQSKILQKISWEEMHLSGDVFEYGSHTHRMHYFDNKGKSGITLNKREQILKDLLLSKQMLETNYFSYPIYCNSTTRTTNTEYYR